jgi:phage terminase large subunit
MQQRGYLYGTHFLPHDAQAKQFAAGGRTIEQMVRATGQKVRIVPRLSIHDGIAAARSIFNRCWFDGEKCADGIQALKHYRYEFDEDLMTFKKEPLHDWASHPADAFRYLAVSITEEDMTPAQQQSMPVYYGSQGWMA